MTGVIIFRDTLVMVSRLRKESVKLTENLKRIKMCDTLKNMWSQKASYHSSAVSLKPGLQDRR